MKICIVAITSDGCICSGHDTYTGVTAHWITKDWELCSAPLQISKKYGHARAENHVAEVEAYL